MFDDGVIVCSIISSENGKQPVPSVGWFVICMNGGRLIAVVHAQRISVLRVKMGEFIILKIKWELLMLRLNNTPYLLEIPHNNTNGLIKTPQCGLSYLEIRIVKYSLNRHRCTQLQQLWLF